MWKRKIEKRDFGELGSVSASIVVENTPTEIAEAVLLEYEKFHEWIEEHYLKEDHSESSVGGSNEPHSES